MEKTILRRWKNTATNEITLELLHLIGTVGTFNNVYTDKKGTYYTKGILGFWDITNKIKL